MLFFANGDSHTIGSELKNEHAYAFSLAKKLKFNNIINIAEGGASNDKILRTTEKYLLDCDYKNTYPNFILIGWSAYTRLDWYYNGRYISVPSADSMVAETQNTKRFEYSKTLFKDDIFISKFTKYFHDKIYNLHLELNQRKIPHMFLNTCFSYYKITAMKDLMLYDWQNRFWEPYTLNGSFYDWAISNNFKETKWHHIEQIGHNHFADLLYKYIIDYDLLSCPSDN